MITEPIADRRPKTASAPSSWRTRAFGMVLEGAFDTLAFEFDPALATEARTVRLCLTDRLERDAAWNSARTERRGQVTLPDGTEIITIDATEELGYRLWSHSVGEYLIHPGVERIECAPVDPEQWHWQRFLIGQVLPLAAALRGAEPLHASGVVFDGRAVAFLGGSSAGKTSLAVQCVLRGAQFLADDVLVLEPAPGQVIAHPGSPLAGIRHAELAQLQAAERARIGVPVTTNEKEVLFRVGRPAEARPLGALFLLERDSAVQTPQFSRVVDPRMLLGSTFNFVHRPPERLQTLLDVCGTIDATAPTFRVSIPDSVSASRLAAAIDAHLQRIL